jgi:hypothetical protein
VIGLVPPKNVLYIEANRGTLVLNKVLPKACMISGTYHYTSGLFGSTDYTKAEVGPLPPGDYTLHPYEISPTNFFRAHLDPRDWGNFRVPLHPDPGTNTYGRSGFFIHGGLLRPGSDGCLKVGGSNQDELFRQLQNAVDPVPVSVTVTVP